MAKPCRRPEEKSRWSGRRRISGGNVLQLLPPQKKPGADGTDHAFPAAPQLEENRKARADAVYAHPAIRKELARWNAMTYVSSYLPQYEFLGRGKAPLRWMIGRGSLCAPVAGLDAR